MAEAFTDMLSGGHHNSLGRTVEVVECVLADPVRFEELFACYRSDDELVRLRTSSALKRVEIEQHDLLVPTIDRLIEEISAIDQASAQWTLADLFARLEGDMSADQRAGALAVMKRNLAEHDDWIVLNRTMNVVGNWAADDSALREWLTPHLHRLTADPRKSVSTRATKLLAKL